jgi:hypothetical protein
MMLVYDFLIHARTPNVSSFQAEVLPTWESFVHGRGLATQLMKSLPAWLISRHGYTFGITERKPEIREMICELVKADSKIPGAKHFPCVFANQDEITINAFLHSISNTLGIQIMCLFHM